jgi:hypothetical protein
MASSSPWPSFNARYPTFIGSGKRFSADPLTPQRTTGRKLAALHATTPAIPLFGLTFVPPDMLTGPWEICTQWSERELMALILVMWPSREALQNFLHYANMFICMQPALNPLCGASIPGYTHKQMFTASFITAAPMPGALALPPATPNPSEPDTPADNEGAPHLHGSWQNVKICKGLT